VAGFFIPRAGNSVAFVPTHEGREASSILRRDSGLSVENVLQHEYTHYFMRQHFPAAYPTWYSEGYAELMGTLRFMDDGSFHIGDPPQSRAYQVLEMKQFPLKEMLDSKHKLSGYDYIQFYGTGWLFSHYLNFNPQRLAELNEYLRALGKGEDSLTAAQRIFGDLDKMQAEMLRYRKGPFPGYDIKPANYHPPEVTTRPMTGAETAMLREEMRLNRGIEDKEAADLAADARRRIKGFENDYGAMLVLARAELRAENFDEADRLAQKLIEMDPARGEAWQVRSETAIERTDDDPAQAPKAREYASKASKLDRGDPRPLIDYYYSYVEAKAEPPEAAVIALEEAFDTSASDPDYRLLLTRQLVNENRMDAARTVLLPIAFTGHSFEEEEEEKDADEPSLRKLLDAISSGDRAGAIAWFDKILEDKDKKKKKGG
jgi:tetratricopeptide (TPR) repeat protein